MAGLVLEPLEVAGPTRWRWLLRTEDGEALASHEVAVPEADYEHRGFVDLYQFLRWESDLDRRLASEAELTARIGAWIGEHLLGPEVMEALFREAPVTVRVPVPPPLGFLPYRPWTIAARQGRVLAREQVGFVFDLPARARSSLAQQPAKTLRMLALFSLPTGGTVLGLRRERRALQQLISELGQGQQPRAVQLRVLQYGVTRQALEAAVDDADGWDVLHVSGHGRTGQLVLETPDGAPDPLGPAELVELLVPMWRRLRLAVLAACESGAATAAELRRMLDLSTQVHQPSTEDSGVGPDRGGAAEPVGWPGLGRALLEKLGCAVLAMRYPVIDDFAIALTGHLYRGLLEHGQTLDVAAARALSRAAPDRPSLSAPAVSLATPALLGPATGLTLQPPSGRAAPISVALAGFPDEPARFVGRTATLTRARRALRYGSGRAGVLLHGPAGVGTTTAAVELAYQAAGTFTAAAWWTAPPAGQWATALASLATALETQLNPALNPDQDPTAAVLQLAGNTSTDTRLTGYLPVLTQLLEQARLLIVLDGLDSVLTSSGGWLDPRFGRVIAALTGHTGASRVVLTSRTVPTGLDTDRVVALPVEALTSDEAVLLARELPHLHALQHDTEPATGTPAPQVAADRALLARTLTVAQGHPKLLEVADTLAADPTVLQQRVTAAEIAATQPGPSGASVPATGDEKADPGQVLAALTGGTT
ncbi:CHAT domain-containing protein [Geodermatophilus siccatus]|uniref:CHAT domain-containing protein n=1 Tax=Geodermatophilus siccatus TaxID=1137991 RepID=UPI000B808A9B|nr:CHAT domain-containing protein [Geodermatophilus siccatus]